MLLRSSNQKSEDQRYERENAESTSREMEELESGILAIGRRLQFWHDCWSNENQAKDTFAVL